MEWHPTKGLLVSGSKDNQIKFWDPRTGTVLSTLQVISIVIYTAILTYIPQTSAQEHSSSSIMVSKWQHGSQRVPRSNRSCLRHSRNERIPRPQRAQKGSLLYVIFYSAGSYPVLTLPTLHSGNMAPSTSNPRLRRVRRCHPPLGPRRARTLIHPTSSRPTRHPLTSTRLERLVARVPSTRPPPRECVERPHNKVLVA